MKIELAKSEVIHFVGIGGIGMSGLSMIMKRKGFKVQGSDISNNKNINRIRKEKIKVLFGKWSGTEVKIDGKEYSIMKESDIMGISNSK